ncbi:hypothetical protein H310_06953 [Aphanomyces invadans]|uniref:Centrosomin N-terminal motif 1 domain-containing protein n=1 Tax=Aphanomyces invadans TaxID=157072 RepID=A0A024U780_9STRA|nr:hypothetical protein H310_06953 [Aphanomyces invadans]ETW01428.1 hypothetical protein H310_06953 [Aphanomyces invadans]|eukprot:XP_008870426.1 hypothetical protein H310_06953 [Aphanomyces invadans]
MESDPHMDLQLIREGEMERERLQKEGFNMKLRINFLEEQLLKYKEGTAFEDEDFESENIHLRTVIEEKVQELERRNALLVRARDAIEDLRSDLEAAKESNRLNASMNQSQLEESVLETQRLEQEVSRLEDDVARLRMQLSEANRKYEDLLRAHDELTLELNERSQAYQQVDAVQQTAHWEKQKMKTDLQVEFEARLNDERDKFQEELAHRTRLQEATLKEKDAAVINLTRSVGDLHATVQALTSQKKEAELMAEICTKQYDALKEQNDKTQQQLIEATKDAGEAISLRNKCEWTEAQLKLMQDRCRDLEGNLDKAKGIESSLRQDLTRAVALNGKVDQTLALQTDSTLREITSKLEITIMTNESLRGELSEANSHITQLEKNMAMGEMALSDMKRKCLSLETQLRQSAVTADKVSSTEDRVQRLESEIAQLHSNEQELKSSLAVVQAEKVQIESMLVDSDRKLAILRAAHENLLRTQGETNERWKQEQQTLKNTIDTLEKERKDLRGQENATLSSLSQQLKDMSDMKGTFEANVQQAELHWNEQSIKFHQSLDKLQQRLLQAHETIKTLSKTQGDTQQQLAKSLRSELEQARLDWERELAQLQNKVRDEGRKAELVQLQHTRALSKLAQVESEYQRTLTDLIKSKEGYDSLKGECDRRGEHIRLLREEVQQARQLRASLESDLRAAMTEQKPLLAKIHQLQGKINDLESQAANDLKQSKYRTPDTRLFGDTNAVPDFSLVDRLDSIVKKSTELQEHTRRFQEKHSAVWNDAVSGTKPMPKAMELECKRLLYANGILCQKLAQVAADWKQSKVAPPNVTHSDLKQQHQNNHIQQQQYQPQSLLNRSELDALVQTLHESKQVVSHSTLESPHGRPHKYVPATTRLVDAYQSSNRVLERLNQELVKVHSTIADYSNATISS